MHPIRYLLLTLCFFCSVLLAQTARDTMGLPSVAGYTHQWAVVSDTVRLHYMDGGGNGPALVLVHGWPETWYAWRELMPDLRQAGYRVIVPDLRGLGDSDRPAGGYDRVTMADDLQALVSDHLELDSVYLVGHDWGGSTAAAWGTAHPETVRRLVVVEAMPKGPWSEGPDPWFYNLHAVRGWAEAMTAGRERTYLTYFYKTFAADTATITDEEIDAYLRTYGSPAGMRAGFEFVRALPLDVENNAALDGRLSPVPVLAVGGEASMGQAVAENLAHLYADVRPVVLPNCGHFVPEEQPEALRDLILSFFTD